MFIADIDRSPYLSQIAAQLFALTAQENSTLKYLGRLFFTINKEGNFNYHV